MIKNKKGFTLIELLAVIVILGLLMAIAIPSVTKYITESRKKTLTTTLGNYIGALVNEVNDLAYTFTGTNTIYAVPIECISLERGGTDPFGHWYQANNAYFAYVLVQYDDTTSKYIYGFTFKDSAGYGLYPTIQPNIKEKGSQIKTGYDLNKPKTGELTSLTSLSKWQESGFKVDSNTHLQVLVASSENQTGDGINTCTLQQKGDNYAKAEEEKKELIEQIEFEKNMMNYPAYAIYSNDDNSLTFIRSNKEIKTGDTYDGKKVTAVYTGFETKKYTSGASVPWYSYRKLITKVVAKHEIAPISTAYWFNEFYECSTFNISKMNTSKVTDMQFMFYEAGYSANSFNLDISNWDTSNVTNMSRMFVYAGCDADSIDLDLSKWDVSKVTDMNIMFFSFGYRATTSITLNLSNWDLSNVTVVGTMFGAIGYAQASNINLYLNNIKFSKLSNINNLFEIIGYNSKQVYIEANDWDISNIKSLGSAFRMVGADASQSVNISVKNWDTSNVTDMNAMFSDVGTYATNVSLNGVSDFDTRNVINMSKMFYFCGYKSSIYLYLKGWDVSKVTNYTNFNPGLQNKIIAPTWVN